MFPIVPEVVSPELSRRYAARADPLLWWDPTLLILRFAEGYGRSLHPSAYLVVVSHPVDGHRYVSASMPSSCGLTTLPQYPSALLRLSLLALSLSFLTLLTSSRMTLVAKVVPALCALIPSDQRPRTPCNPSSLPTSSWRVDLPRSTCRPHRLISQSSAQVRRSPSPSGPLSSRPSRPPCGWPRPAIRVPRCRQDGARELAVR